MTFTEFLSNAWGKLSGRNRLVKSITDQLMKTMPDLFVPKKPRDMLSTEPIVPYPGNVMELYIMKRYTPELSTIINELNKEIFREGIIIDQRVESYCEKCDKEYSEHRDKCGICGTELGDLDKSGALKLEKFFRKCSPTEDLNEYSFTDLMRLLQDDVETTDGCWMMVQKDYVVDEKNNILDFEPVAILRGHPHLMRLVRNKYDQAKGYDVALERSVFTCVLHREDNIHEYEGKCKYCQRPLVPCVAVALDEKGQPLIGYIPNEVYYRPKYNPSEDYGTSNIVTGWVLANTNLNMDLLVNVTYREQRPVKGILVFNTKNATSLLAQLKGEDTRREQEPNYVPRFCVETESAHGGVSWVPITQDFSELQTIDMKADNIRRLAALYGVLPVFTGDVSVSGGLNNEGMQITVTLRAVEFGHQYWHEGGYAWLSKQLKTRFFRYKFQEPIEEDKTALQQRRLNNLAQIQQLLQMGVEIDLTDQTELNFTITGEFKKPEQMGPQGPSGGGGSEGTPWESNSPPSVPQVANLSLTKSRGIDEFEHFKSDMNLVYNQIFTQISKNVHGNMSQEEQKDLARSVVRDVRRGLGDVAYSNYANLIIRGFRDSGVDITKADIDMDSIIALAEESPIFDSFEGIEENIKKDIDKIIVESFAVPGEFSVRSMVGRMREVADRHAWELERVARTESNAIVNLGREKGYEQQDDGTFKYSLTGQFHDSAGRTCDAHNWMHDQIQKEGGSVTMKRLKELNKMAHEKFWPEYDPRGFNIHWNQRKGIVRVL